jgi:AmiR/NasT family two-component response regulator
LPLEVKEKVIGVLNCYTSQPHDFSETEISMLISVAHQSAIAIENAELLVKSKIIQEELETRKRVERAKGILMKKDKLTEDEAYQKLQKYSMNHRKSMREIAEAIIMVEEMSMKGLK